MSPHVDKPVNDDIARVTAKTIYQEIIEAFDTAKQAYKDADMVKMEAYLKFAHIQSTLLIAQRIDLLIRTYKDAQNV